MQKLQPKDLTREPICGAHIMARKRCIHQQICGMGIHFAEVLCTGTNCSYTYSYACTSTHAYVYTSRCTST
eukprot:6516053-Karenia_brevis.AAC.1